MAHPTLFPRQKYNGEVTLETMKALRRHYDHLSRIQFVRDIFVMQIGKGAYMAMTLLHSVLLARLLGVEGYGVYAVVLAFTATVKTFISLGQGPVLQVFFAEEYGRKNRNGMAAVLKNFLMAVLVNTLLLSSAALIAPYLSTHLYGAPNIGNLARFLLLYTAVDMGNSAMLMITQSVRRVRLQTMLEQSAIFSFIVVSTTALLLGYGIGGVVVSQLAVSFFFLIISALTYRRLMRIYGLPGLREVLRASTTDAFVYFRQGLWFSVDKNIGSLYPSGLFFVMSLVAAPAQIGLARIAMQMAGTVQSFLLPQINSLATTVLASFTRDNVSLLRKNAAKIIKHALFLHAILSFGAIFVLPFAIVILYGKEFIPAITLTFWIIILGLMSPIGLLNSPLLRLYRKVHYGVVLSIVTLILMWTAMYFLPRVVDPEVAFLIAFGIGQIVAVIIAWWIFMVLIRRTSLEHSPSRMKGRWKNILANMTLLGVSLIVIIAILEVFLRVSGIERLQSRRPHLHQASDIEGVYYEFIPNLKNIRGYNWERISTNGSGFRGKEIDPEKPSIVLIGDSFVFGFGVDDAEVHSHHLQEEFPGHNVINTGVNGYNIEQEVRAYLAKFRNLRPKLAIVEFVFNDMAPPSILTDEKKSEVHALDTYLSEEKINAQIEAAVTATGTLKIPFKFFLQQNSAVFNFIEHRTKWLPFRAKDASYEQESISEQDLAFYQTWLKQLADHLSDSEKIFVIWPEARPNTNARTTLTEMAESYGFHVVDLYETFGLRYPSLSWDWHPNAHAHAKVAEVLTKTIREEKLLED